MKPLELGRVQRTAAQWFALRRSSRDAQLERDFQEWLAADPRHAEDYALYEITWDVATDAIRGMPMPPERPGVRRRLWSAAVLLSAACAAGIAFWFWPATISRYDTGAGEQRTLRLADGSRLTLNTRTQVTVRLAHRSRDIDLRTGEAYFEVVKDASRPFTVHTPLGSARAVGTHFNVYVQPAQLAVTTSEGRVLVSGGSAGSGVFVDAGRQARVDAGAAGAVVSGVDLSGALNWREHRLEVNDAPLDGVLREFSRYTDVPVRAADAEIGALRVTAVLRTGDVQALRATLREAFGLSLVRHDAQYLVSRADARR